MHFHAQLVDRTSYLEKHSICTDMSCRDDIQCFFSSSAAHSTCSSHWSEREERAEAAMSYASDLSVSVASQIAACQALPMNPLAPFVLVFFDG